MATEQINIVPRDSGDWNWVQVVEGEVAGVGPGFENRSDAIAAGREAGGSEEVKVIRGNGEEETHRTPPNCRVALLRLDGSEVGELDPAPGDSAVGQSITLEPATEKEVVAHG